MLNIHSLLTSLCKISHLKEDIPVSPDNVQLKELAKNRIFRHSLAGLAVRLLVAPFLGHPFDLRVFMAVGRAVAHGLTPYGEYILQNVFVDMSHPHLYGTFLGIGYPPPWGLICGLMYQVGQFLGSNIYAYAWALKFPIIVGDLTTAYILYRVLRGELNQDQAWKAYCLYLWCPFVFVVGVVWGMFDILAFLFSLASACLLLKRRSLSSVSLGVASAFKLFPAVLAPIYSIFVYRKTGSGREAVEYLLGTVAITAFLTLFPMAVFNWPLSNLYHALAYHVDSPQSGMQYNLGSGYTYGGASPFNVINVIRLFIPWGGMPFLFSVVWILACLILYWYASQKMEDTGLPSVFRWSFVTMLVFFTTRSWVSEQNLLFLFSFFLLTAVFQSGSWRKIHGLWIVLFSFVLVHVPFIAFLWMPYPWTLNAASAFCDGPWGWTRWLAMTALTFAWMGICWHYALKEVKWPWT